LTKFGVWAFIPAKTEETQNTNFVGDFPTFPTSGQTPEFATERRSYSPLSEERFSDGFRRISFLTTVTLPYSNFSNSFCMQDANAMPWHDMSVLYVLTKENFCQYRWRSHNRWQNALKPVVSSNETAYDNVVSVPAENTIDIIYTSITTYPPSGAHAFNAAWTALHTLRERIHFPWKGSTEHSYVPTP